MTNMASDEERKEEQQEMVKRSYTFDDIFDHVGHFGCYQFSFSVFSCLIEVSVAFTVVYIIFESANPGWTCIPGTGVDNLNDTFKNVTENNMCPIARCYNISYKDEFTTISTEWDLICEYKYLIRVIQSTFFAAVLVGAWLGGFLADTYGRKKVVMIEWVLLMLLQASTGLAHVWMLYLALRIPAGLCAGGLAAIALIIPAEYLGPKYRSICSYRYGWAVAGALNGLVAFLLRNWRWHVAVMGLLMMPLVPVIAILLPESARWLVKKGRLKEAEAILKKIAKHNGKDPENLGHLLAKIAEAEVSREEQEKAYSYLDLFRTKRYATRTLAVIWMWFSVSFITYGITSSISDLSGNIYLNAAIGYMIQGATSWTVIVVPDKIGRKNSFYVYISIIIACLTTVMVLIICNRDGSLDTAITSLVLLSYGGVGPMWSMVFLIPLEAYPTLIRSRSIATGNVSARVAGILAPQVHLLVTIHPTIPYIIYITSGICACVLVKFFIPETNGRPLPENIHPSLTKHRTSTDGERGMMMETDLKS